MLDVLGTVSITLVLIVALLTTAAGGLHLYERRLAKLGDKSSERQRAWLRAATGLIILADACIAIPSFAVSVWLDRENEKKLASVQETATNAQHRAADLGAQRALEARRSISVDQFDKLVAGFREINQEDRVPLYVVVVSAKQPVASFQVAGVVADAILEGQVGASVVEEVPEVPLHGFVLYSTQCSPRLRQFMEAMRSAGLNVRLVGGAAPDTEAAKWADQPGQHVARLYVGEL